MPNHCENILIIEGKPKLINKLLKQVEITESEATSDNEATIFSCHKIIPQPTFQGEEWYEWRINNWGSKWGAYDLQVFSDDWESGYYELYFQSAWSPILPVIEKLVSQYPKLNFFYKYWEGGSDFWGKHTWKNGELIHSEEGQLSNADCEIREEFYGEEHHWCRECGHPYTCNSNDELCNTCLEEELKLQEELLDEGEKESETNLVSVGTNNTNTDNS